MSYDAAIIQNSGNMRLFTAEFPAVYGTCALSFPFRLRFSVKITVCIIVVISFIQMGLGLWAAFFSGGKAALASAVSTVVYVVFYFIAVKVNFGRHCSPCLLSQTQRTL